MQNSCPEVTDPFPDQEDNDTDGCGDDKITAFEELAVRAILFGLFPIICSSNIQHDIFSN